LKNFYRLIQGDCTKILPTLDSSNIDLVITSPPYNVGINYGEGREKDKIPFQDYYNFAFMMTKELHRVLKPSGRFCIEIGGSGRNFPLSWCWQDVAYKSGFGLYSEIFLDHRKTNPTAWGSWLQANNVFTIPNFHVVYVFYNGNESKNGGKTTISPKEFVEWTRGHWKIKYGGRITDHPAEFPEELPLRFMKLFGHVHDVVLDPFIGSGTTMKVAQDLERSCIGIDISPEYCEMSKKRCFGRQFLDREVEYSFEVFQ